MKEKEIRHIREEIPVTGYDEEKDCFTMADGGLMDIYQIVPRDLVNSDVDEIEMDVMNWAKFYRVYGGDVTILSLLFPCDTGEQQRYWKQRLKNNQNPEFTPMIKTKIRELEWRQKNSASKEFFLIVYSTEDTKADADRTIWNTLGTGDFGLVAKIRREKKEQILFKLANKNSLIF